ncbi:chemotaxis protein CheD [Roseateles sp. BYS180W]|uniref:Probable chemoreceptor glutamine deamidase CheD n=1 Tax=Roseateles rivi TaxID=3299028 RepID=A0ABW7FU79_9BURK
MHKPVHSTSLPAPPPPKGQVLNLMPGQWHVGQEVKLSTLLGSCVAVTLWHPRRKIGGMCHYLLPSRPARAAGSLDARYGEEALELMAQALMRSGTRTQDYVCHLYGGADTMPDQTNIKFNVGERNIAMAWDLIDRYGFQLESVDVGDFVPRTVTMDLGNGLVEVRRGKPTTIAAPVLKRGKL